MFQNWEINNVGGTAFQNTKTLTPCNKLMTGQTETLESQVFLNCRQMIHVWENIKSEQSLTVLWMVLHSGFWAVFKKKRCLVTLSRDKLLENVSCKVMLCR